MSWPDPPTYSEHMAWCKERALAYLDRGDLTNAIASFASDVRKEECTADNPTVTFLIATEGLAAASTGDSSRMRRFIEGFAS